MSPPTIERFALRGQDSFPVMHMDSDRGVRLKERIAKAYCAYLKATVDGKEYAFCFDPSVTTEEQARAEFSVYMEAV